MQNVYLKSFIWPIRRTWCLWYKQDNLPYIPGWVESESFFGRGAYHFGSCDVSKTHHIIDLSFLESREQSDKGHAFIPILLTDKFCPTEDF